MTMGTNQEPISIPTEITERPTPIPEQPTTIAVQPTATEVTKGQQVVTKTQPSTISKNPARVAAGKKTAQLMRQRRAEANVRQSEPAHNLNEPWLTYAFGGMAIVGLVVFANRYFNNSSNTTTNNNAIQTNKIPELHKQEPKLFQME